MPTPRALALKEWNRLQPAWTPVKRYDQLTPAEQSVVDKWERDFKEGLS